MRKKLYPFVILALFGLSCLTASCKTKKSGCDAYGKANKVESATQV